jgi:hypothetical protein
LTPTREPLELLVRQGLAVFLVLGAALSAYSIIIGHGLHPQLQAAAYFVVAILLAVVAFRTSRRWLSWLLLVIGWLPILLLSWAMFSV